MSTLLAALPARASLRATLRSAIRFAVVGLAGTLLDLGLFAALTGLIGLAAAPANLLSYAAGIANNYTLNRAWTYAGCPRRGMSQFTRFAAVSLTALALNTLVVALLAPSLGGLAAKLCASAVGLGWNFLGNHLWTFRGSR